MKKILKRGLSLVLTLIMVAGLLPVTAFAAVESSGRPKDVNNTLVLSFYTGDGFPGEPAVYGTGNYKNINSSFAVKSGATFANTANNQLDWDKINKDIVQGASSGSTSVWGVYDANGTKDYFLPNASIIDPDNEIKMIRAVKGCSAEEAKNYEIIWYVIKLQHSSGWFGRTEWHIDGVIKEKSKISINYYGNGNTSGNAPLGETDHTSGEPYTVLTKNTLKRVMNGAEVAFLGWSAKADGTGEEQGFYQPGDVINPTKSISLYAMWDTTTQYTATVNTYLDGELISDSVIHNATRTLSLSSDNQHFYDLTESSTKGVYTTKITGNGKFHLYLKNADDTYTQIGTHQLTIYNQNGSLDVHHYSVTYDANSGAFETAPGAQKYMYGDAVTAINDVPTKDGYRFLGWNTKKDGTGTTIKSGGAVTDSITAPITLYAQWEKTVNVKVNVTINHNGGGGYDQLDSKNEVSMALVSRADSQSPYLEVKENTLSLSDSKCEGFTFSEIDKVTTYLADGYTFVDLPGGTAEYTVVTSKSGYDTQVTSTKDENGDWVINVEMTYNPSNFDLKFTVKVHEDVPAHYIPDAAIVKVTFWADREDSEGWEIITQQKDDLPGVRVNLTEGKGSGSYPVWKHESNGTTPYGYRIEVTSFVYPDGTIVRANQEVTPDVAWSDGVYTATVSDVTGGQEYGTLKGAYIGENDLQVGTLNAVITMDLYSVTFDAQGGKVNGKDSETVTKQYKIPAFKDYVPTRGDGYTFGGWYEDANCTKAATEGADLTKDITLYAKWIEPLTIKGDVTVSGTYLQNGTTVNVHDIDRAEKVYVVLQEIRDGRTYEVDSELVSITYDENKNGSGAYSFSGIPNDGKEYRIELLVLNYNTKYDNESDAGTSYSAGEYKAVFGGDNVAQVDSYLEFVPPSYKQEMKVDATPIGEGFRPGNVLSEIVYRDVGDIHPFQVISQHTVAPKGVPITLTNGVGSGDESIWKWHTDGTLYEYQMNITKVDGKDYDSDTAPFYIIYSVPAYWDGNSNNPSGELVATLCPNTYPVTFDLNEGTAVQVTYTDKNGDKVVVNNYAEGHTWSYTTKFNAVPVREGYIFKGWESNVTDVTSNDKGDVTIPADVHQEVVLKAKWEKKTYTVTTVSDPAGISTTTGDGTYEHGAMVTVTASSAEGYTFDGWYEGSRYITNTLKYEFVANADRNLTAKFTKNKYQITASSHNETFGSAAGSGSYEEGATATVTATANDGYKFLYWKEGDEQVSSEATYSFSVNCNRELVAHFASAYKITAIAENGGSAEGTGWYFAEDTVKLTAKPTSGYNFIGWYENGEFVSDKAEYTLDGLITGDRTFTAKFKQKVSLKCDYVYLFGYNDTEIGATGPLLRNELSQMIYRLVKQNDLSTTPGKHSYSNTAGQWFESGISYMVKVGALDDAKANSPYASVTCGETYKMICLGLNFTNDTSLNYSEYAALLRNYNLPASGSVTATIKRWEFCELFNAILGRSDYELVDAAGNEITAADYGYTDLTKDHHYYRIMMIATSTFEGGKVVNRMDRNTYDYDGE